MNRYYLVFLVICFSSHINAQLNPQKAVQYDSWLHTLGEIINIFEMRYYKDVSPEETMSNAIKAYAQQDPHTVFLDKKSCKSLQEKMSGEFFGIGIVLPGDLKKEEEFFPIIETVPGGPSDKDRHTMGDIYWFMFCAPFANYFSIPLFD